MTRGHETHRRRSLAPLIHRLRAILVRVALGGCAILIASAGTAGTAGDPRRLHAPPTAAIEVQEATTGRKLVEQCAGTDVNRTAWCEAYITGVIEGMFGTRSFPSRCLKGMPHFGELRRLVVEFATMSSLQGDDYTMRRPAPLMIRDVLTVKYCG